jgi:hypothetical protein
MDYIDVKLFQSSPDTCANNCMIIDEQGCNEFSQINIATRVPSILSKVKLPPSACTRSIIPDIP